MTHPERHAISGCRPRTAFVFSGGGSGCACHAGMLHALYEQGVVADLMVATSLGALNAAFVASRPQTSATARALARAWNAMDRSELFPVSMRALVGGITGQRDHLVSASGLRQVIQRNVQLADLADAEIPVCLLSFDLNLGSEVTISRGPAVDAILAACSTPGIFAPVLSGDRLLVEAATTGAPIARAVELGPSASTSLLAALEVRRRRPPAPRLTPFSGQLICSLVPV